jgi:hypothetical protein
MSPPPFRCDNRSAELFAALRALADANEGTAGAYKADVGLVWGKMAETVHGPLCSRWISTITRHSVQFSPVSQSHGAFRRHLRSHPRANLARADVKTSTFGPSDHRCLISAGLSELESRGWSPHDFSDGESVYCFIVSAFPQQIMPAITRGHRRS